MGALLFDLAVLDDQDEIRIADGGKPVRNGNDRLLPGDAGNGFLNLALGFNIDRC